MSRHTADVNVRPDPDPELTAIADYVCDYRVDSDTALETARWCLMDSLGCAMLALHSPDCVRHLGPVVPGTIVPNGSRIPGTSFQLDPIQAAFTIGAMVRWLDFNDTWLAAEWGHPSDNLGTILALADYLSRSAVAVGEGPLNMGEVLRYMVKAHEIQGVLALENGFNRVGLDHVLLVKVASAAVATHMLGGGRNQVVDSLSHAWVDGQALRTYRHAPNTGSRKSWAAGDACGRAVRLALMVMKGETGLPSVLSAPRWGFYDVLLRGEKLRVEREYGSYVMENVLFKLSFPAEFHAQTAVECAIRLHDRIRGRVGDIERVEIATQESALRIISKDGPLHNPADRDHCLQYMVAVALIFGELTAHSYEDEVAADPRIDSLREKMRVSEDPRYSRDYLDPSRRSIANAVQVFFRDGSKTDRIEVEYPIGHRRRREEGIPILVDKFRNAIGGRFAPPQASRIFDLCMDAERLSDTPAQEFVDLFSDTTVFG